MLVSRVVRFSCLGFVSRAITLVCFVSWVAGELSAQGVASIQNISSQPFVTGFTPVIGPNGGVGGVLVDAQGVVSRIEQDELDDLRSRWKKVSGVIDEDVLIESDFRVVSLTRLDRALAERIDSGQTLTQEMLFLAGLQRIEFVFSVPDRNDVLLAGPGGAWKANEAGEVVSVKHDRPVLRLDDLIDALRAAPGAQDGGFSCSIEPTSEGMQRFAKLRPRIRSFSKDAVRKIESAIGPQQILLDGIDSGSHFARVMVSADVVMKRLAMGFDASPVDAMPSYLELLKQHSSGIELSSPRWWMAADYDPMLCTPDRLCWQIRGAAVKTMTEDSVLTQRGQRIISPRQNRLAQQWADTMTGQYDQLSSSLPIFGELRNCFDLAVVGALMASEGLAVRADCDWSVLLDPDRLQGPRLPIPKSIPSAASLVRGRKGWIVSVSGGVKMDAWSVVNDVETNDKLNPKRSKALKSQGDRWWW